jgi:hypothetical protein
VDGGGDRTLWHLRRDESLATAAVRDRGTGGDGVGEADRRGTEARARRMTPRCRRAGLVILITGWLTTEFYSSTARDGAHARSIGGEQDRKLAPWTRYWVASFDLLHPGASQDASSVTHLAVITSLGSR